VRPGERDVDRWQQALGRARQAHADGELQVAREGVEEALGVWRGPPLGGVTTSSQLAAERARLEEERLGAIIEGIELDLELGRHGELLGQLDALVIEHPFKERLAELQMLALYRSGRQADALATFQAVRGRFVDELGIEPAERLRDLQKDILEHSAELWPSVGATSDGAREVQPLSPMPPALAESALPVPPNRTIGRGDDVAAVAERLRTASVRLLTLTGPGGVGKTRVALEAARAVQADFPDAACFISLAAVLRPEDVPAAIVNSLGIVLLAGESPEQAVKRFLAAKHLVLIADNFEHLLTGAPFIGALVGVCPTLTVLATSREPLALHAEERYPVSPLALPAHGTPDTEALAGVDAVVLFCERARAHDPDFRLTAANADAVAEICRHVDGLPLAIELAAARCGLLSPGEIAERLEQALAAPGAGARDAPARHQTLRATIDWSHDLLSDDDKQCFARFAVFAGGATVQAAETVTAASLDTLDGLVAKSLLVRRHPATASTRLGMLETIRAYAAERFADMGDADVVRERHGRWYLALAERNGAERALWGACRSEHLARLDAETDNLARALAWAVDRRDGESALAMCAALRHYWMIRDRHTEAGEWIDRILSLPGDDPDPASRVRVLSLQAVIVWRLGRGAEQPALLAEAEAISRALGDSRILSQVLQLRAACGEGEAATGYADEALDLANATGDDWEVAMATSERATCATNIVELRERVDHATALFKEVGNVYEPVSLLARAAGVALELGSYDDAKEYLGRAIPIAHILDHPGLWVLIRTNFGMAALLTGDTDGARESLRDALELSRKLVVRPFARLSLVGLAALAAMHDDSYRAAKLAGAATTHGYGEPETPDEAAVEASFIQPARTRHGAAAWDAAAREGAALSFDEAIAYALED
jgi:predicted ATPase